MPLKRINPRLAKLHRSYSVFELAKLLGVHRHTVREWLKRGLPAVDNTRPVLVLGCDFQTWWSLQRKKAKRPLQPGQFYCCKCRDAKAPAFGMVEYAATNATTGNLKAMCETCETIMHRRVNLTDIAAKMPNLDVRLTQAVSSIMERTTPCLNIDDPEGA